VDNYARLKQVWIAVIYLLLLAIIIPWYWPEEDVRQFYGFPIWALLSLSGLFLTSSFTAWVCLRRGVEKE